MSCEEEESAKLDIMQITYHDIDLEKFLVMSFSKMPEIYRHRYQVDSVI
jgi:hypothetical protein